MKPTDLFVDGLDFGTDESELGLIVRRGFEALGGPSQCVTEAISAEARRAAGRSRFRRFWPSRLIAAAAAAAVIAAGTIYFNQSAPGNDQPGSGLSAESTQDLAVLLLEIQGLNEEEFFMTEAAEPLWL
ncbi:MAG: hypothetical protein PHU80_03605 [Kiritimatiellae bacterium]|nr:hypothetical protein [Kiritimatiellia bacterium]